MTPIMHEYLDIGRPFVTSDLTSHGIMLTAGPLSNGVDWKLAVYRNSYRTFNRQYS
jgi:hypothetical protein